MAEPDDDALGDFADIDPRLLGIGLTEAEATLLECVLVIDDAETWDRLYGLDIPGYAITGGSPFNELCVEPVCFLPGDRFELARYLRDQNDNELAVVIPALDGSGRTRDLVAWSMGTGATATWRGAPLLGEENVDLPRIADDGRLRAHPSPLEWLRDGRRGIVVLDPKRARWMLAERGLIVADVDFGVRLDAALALPAPDIFVDVQNERAAA